MERATDDIKILVNRTSFGFTDGFSVMRTEPCLNKGLVSFIIVLFQNEDHVFPHAIHLFTNGIVPDFRQNVTFQHLCRCQAQTTVIHGYEHFMSVLFCSGHDFNKEYLLCKPITEVQKHIICNICREHINDIRVATIQISHGFAAVRHIKIIVVKDSLHTLLTVIYIDVKGFRTKRLRKNHSLDHVVALTDFLQAIVQIHQQQCQRRKALLAIDNSILTSS